MRCNRCRRSSIRWFSYRGWKMSEYWELIWFQTIVSLENGKIHYTQRLQEQNYVKFMYLQSSMKYTENQNCILPPKQEIRLSPHSLSWTSCRDNHLVSSSYGSHVEITPCCCWTGLGIWQIRKVLVKLLNGIPQIENEPSEYLFIHIAGLSWINVTVMEKRCGRWWRWRCSPRRYPPALHFPATMLRTRYLCC